MFAQYFRHAISVASIVSLFGPAYTQISTAKHNIDTNITSGYWIVTIDFDFDGDPDIVACSIQSGLRWYENDGSASFTIHTISSTFNSAWSIHASDIDSDGDMDVVSSSADPKDIAWFRNNGDGTFTQRTVESNYLHAHGVYAADLDNDGDTDLMAAVWENGSVVWWENDGQENFTRHVLDGNFSSAHGIQAADVDQDGDMDIISGGGSQTAWWENLGGGQFDEHQLGSFGAFGIEAVDLDDDGDIDIMRNQRNNGDIDWFENNNNNFTERLVAGEVGEAWSQVAGDLDLDGDKDVVVAEFVPNQITYWLNNGNQNFTRMILDDTVTRPRCVNLADYDGDGDLDIAAILNKNKSVVWYEVLGSPTPQNQLTVTAPDGGEQFEAGSTITVTWSSEGDVSAVKLEYSSDAGATWNTIADNVPDSGTHNWQSPLINSTAMRVRVSEVGDATVFDVSDAVFSLIISSLQLTAPNGGEAWVGDQQETITWTSSGLVQSVTLEYSVNNGVDWTEITSTAASSGSFSWTVVDVQTSNALIRISDAADGSPSDVSDAPFSIDGSEITVTSPNGGESWFGATLQPITWTSDGNIDSVRIEYSSDGGSTWSLVIASKLNDGQLSWNVPSIASSNMVVRVSHTDDGVPSDVSNAAFTVTPQSVTVTAPNGGEEWTPGSVQNVTWTSIGVVQDVKIEHSITAGNTWQTVVESTPNDGTFQWTLPQVETETALIRISDAADGFPFDVSNGTFAIRTPGLTIVAPNGGELWNGGTEQTIRWATIGNITQVDLEYSLDAGNSWSSIVSDTVNTGTHVWHVPNQTSTIALIRIFNADDTGVFDISDNTFTTVRTALAITHPNGGEVLESGSTLQITWNSNGQISSVNLFLKASPTADATPIVENFPNSGSFSWHVPDEPATAARIRIEDAEDPGIWDESDGSFSIVRAGLTIVSPNGGESLMGGDLQAVTWQSLGDIDSVKVEYSLNAGATWFLSGIAANAGSYEWQVPNQLTTNALIRISDLSDASTYDASDDTFTIISSSLTLTAPNGGEEWLVNSTQIIAWQFSGILQTVRLEYSLNNGAAWSLLATAAPNSGSYSWTVPNFESDSVLVRISNPASGVPSDVSDAHFKITSVISSVPITRNPELLPTEFALAQNYPNPFNLGTRIEFAVPRTSEVTLNLFDLRGRLVHELHRGQLAPGVYSLVWDGRDDLGRVAPTGVYIYSVRIGNWQTSRRLMLVK